MKIIRIVLSGIFIFITIHLTAQYKILWNFNFSRTNGNGPYGNVSIFGNKMYGMTSMGGLHGDGIVFSMDTTGNNFKVSHSFNDTAGMAPHGSLTISGNKMYGMTASGGTHSYGTIFSIDTTGANFKSLWNFNDTLTNGANPYGSLILLRGKLYGMTFYGGTGGQGVIFSIDTDGANYKDICNFNGTNGGSPLGSLIESAGVLYGMTEMGGTNKHGNIFSIDTDGTNFHDLYDFGAIGMYPYGSLILIAKKLYGMLQLGGAHGSGLIFTLDTNGNNFKTIYNLLNINGDQPLGTLSYKDGRLFGMSFYGGAYGDGAIFAVDTTGNNFQDLFSFNHIGNTGFQPYGDLTFAGQNVYGMTSAPLGLIFKFSLALQVHVTDTNISCSGGVASLNALSGFAPYTYLWMPGGYTADSVSPLSAGTYTVTITDHIGQTVSDTINITQPAVLTIIGNSTSSDSVTCVGSAWVKVNSGGTPPYRYRWSGGQTKDSISKLCPGNYCCTVSDAHGCSDTVCVAVNLVAATNNIENHTVLLNIYPNPNGGKFILSGTETGTIIEIYGNLGQKITSFIVKYTMQPIDISNLSNGIYLIRVLSKDGTLIGNQKFIKTY